MDKDLERLNDPNVYQIINKYPISCYFSIFHAIFLRFNRHSQAQAIENPY